MSNFIKKVLVFCVACAASISCKQNSDSTTNYADTAVGDEIIAELTSPPFVPKPVGVKVNFGSFNYENYFGFLGSPNAKGYADLTIPGSGGIFAQLF